MPKIEPIEISNIDGLPVETVGELRELLKPFMDSVPITPVHLFYNPVDDNRSASIIIQLDAH